MSPALPGFPWFSLEAKCKLTSLNWMVPGARVDASLITLQDVFFCDTGLPFFCDTSQS